VRGVPEACWLQGGARLKPFSTSARRHLAHCRAPPVRRVHGGHAQTIGVGTSVGCTGQESVGISSAALRPPPRLKSVGCGKGAIAACGPKVSGERGVTSGEPGGVPSGESGSSPLLEAFPITAPVAASCKSLKRQQGEHSGVEVAKSECLSRIMTSAAAASPSSGRQGVAALLASSSLATATSPRFATVLLRMSDALRLYVWPPSAGWAPLPSVCSGCLTVEVS